MSDKEVKSNSNTDMYDSIRFLGISALTGLTLGIAGGIAFTFRFEKFKFKIGEHSAPAIIAARALGIGTILCFGSVAAGVGTFSLITGIHTLPQFTEASKKSVAIFRRKEMSEILNEEDERELKEIESWFIEEPADKSK